MENKIIKYIPVLQLILILVLFFNHLLRGLIVTPFIPLIILSYCNYAYFKRLF